MYQIRYNEGEAEKQQDSRNKSTMFVTHLRPPCGLENPRCRLGGTGVKVRRQVADYRGMIPSAMAKIMQAMENTHTHRKLALM